MSDYPQTKTQRSSSSSRASVISPATLSGGSSLNTNPTASGAPSTNGQSAEQEVAINSGRQDTGVDGNSARRRNRPRNSGGFLLGPQIFAGPQDGQRSVSGASGNKASRKRSNIRKSSLRTPGSIEGTKGKAAVGRSPLANEVTEATYGSEGAAPTSSRAPSRDSREDSVANSKSEDGSFASPTFDSDPAQIVSLALNLSDNRRRHFSTGRLSPLDPPGGKRIVSNQQTASTLPSSPGLGGSLRHHLNQHRRISKNISPKTDRSPARGNNAEVQNSRNAIGTENGTPLLPGLHLGALVDPQFCPSDATLARADKAKEALELAFQYRRLLQYLPKLPPSPESRPSTGKGANSHTLGFSQPLGRVYNPLQYVRNRKIRVPQRCVLNSEADGWKDLRSVSEWVDLVARERPEHVSTVTNEHRLPQFSGKEEEPALDDPLSSTSARGPMGQSTKKSVRPRSDWWTSPWDFFGDAYWLDQGDNKRFIEDRKGRKLYGTPSGIPNIKGEPIAMFSRRSASITRPVKTSEKPRNSRTSLEVESPKDRGRARHQPHGSIQSIHEYSSSRDRKSRWPHKLIRSRSPSSSGGSDTGSPRGFPRTRGQDLRTIQDNLILERQVKALLAKNEDTIDWEAIKDFEDPGTSAGPSANPSAFASRHASTGNGDERARAMIRAKNLDQTPPRASLSDNRRPVQEISPSVDGFDSTAPNSPDNRNVVPSIAINLSSKQNGRSSSNTRPIGPQRSILSDISKEREQVQTMDFASMQRPSHRRTRTKDTNVIGNLVGSLIEKAPASKSMDEGGRLRRRRSDRKLSKRSRESKDPESRLRGLLKGARLADIVSTPVNKIGDYIWRKDDADQPNPISPGLSYAFDLSETDDSISKSRLSTTTTEMSRQSSNMEPKYHIDNLPVFKSPFSRDQDQRQSKNGQDHIARQQTALRERRSGRFDRLAPPNLDMRSVSPSPTRSPGRVEGKESEGISDDSRRQSAGGDRRGAVVNSSDMQHHRQPTGGDMDTYTELRKPGRASFENDVGFMNLKLQPSTKKVTEIDLARTTALVTSSCVKGNEIVRLATSVRDRPPQILRVLQQNSSTPIGPVSRTQEPVIIGGLLVKSIDEGNAGIREAAANLSDKIMTDLHEQLHGLGDLINNKLSGMVRTAADDADALGSDLATDCTMELKLLNENIDLVMRRRRRRLRWIRRAAYWALEWALLALMWLVWMVVVMIRIARGLVKGVYKSTKWLLWL